MWPEGISWGQQGQSWDTHRVSEKWEGVGQWGTPGALTLPDPMHWDTQVMRGTPKGNMDRVGPGCILETPDQPWGSPDHSNTPEVMGLAGKAGRGQGDRGAKSQSIHPWRGRGNVHSPEKGSVSWKSRCTKRHPSCPPPHRLQTRVCAPMPRIPSQPTLCRSRDVVSGQGQGPGPGVPSPHTPTRQRPPTHRSVEPGLQRVPSSTRPKV